MSDRATQGLPATRRRAPRRRGAAAAAVALVVVSGCAFDEALPPHVSDPALTETPDGAHSAYHGVLDQFRLAFGGINQHADNALRREIPDYSFVAATGMLTDELVYNGGSLLDRRAEGPAAQASSEAYSALQRVRGQGSQALGLLTRHVPEEPTLRAHIYALEGYAEVFLAELFCSGVPLATLDYGGDYTLQPGSTTEEVFRHAAALFDTTLALAGSDARLADLARVGRGRALLGIGVYAEAAAAVGPVGDAYTYDVQYSTVLLTDRDGRQYRPTSFAVVTPTAEAHWSLSVPDREGGNGVEWQTSGDPRSRVTQRGTTDAALRLPVYHPNKYAPDGSSPIVLASGIEARLIEAEAALQAGDVATWLAKLNYLRQTLWTTIRDCSSGTCVAGTDAPLPDLDDPGAALADPAAAAKARVDLLFRERALWLFLTGHRQGDLRRLIRQYGRTPDSIYPVGTYIYNGLPYGSDFKAPIPPQEFASPLFTGCQPGN